MNLPALPSDKSLRKINKALLIFIIAVNGYIVISPFLPWADYLVKKNITKPLKAAAAEPAGIDRTRDHLVIPELQMDEPVYSGQSPSTVHRGIWLRPNTSTPYKGSNTVLVGHRFTYDGPSVFYNLDKLPGDSDIYLVYSGKIYHYRVSEIKIVPPTAVEVEAPSAEPRLTLYTCTPLLTAENRLVYETKLVDVL